MFFHLFTYSLSISFMYARAFGFHQKFRAPRFPDSKRSGRPDSRDGGSRELGDSIPFCPVARPSWATALFLCPTARPSWATVFLFALAARPSWARVLFLLGRPGSTLAEHSRNTVHAEHESESREWEIKGMMQMTRIEDS